MIPLEEDAEALRRSLQQIRCYLATEQLVKVTSDAKRQLRLLDLLSQQRLHTHFLDSATCRQLRDVDVLAWLLDPDSSHRLFAVCPEGNGADGASSSGVAAKDVPPNDSLSANTPPSTIPTPADPPSSDATPVVDNSHASDGMVDYLFHALHPNEPNELSIRDVWTREDPVKTVRQLLHVTGVIHVLAASDSHTALSDGADAEERPHRIRPRGAAATAAAGSHGGLWSAGVVDAAQR